MQPDVLVIGGGLAGLAACVHLGRGGLQVICLEPREHFPHIVGESLDWSAPPLFADLGLTMEQLVETGAATFKRHIKITSIDGREEEYLPGPWLAKRPWNVELRTLHLDRQHIHKLLQEKVSALGITTLHERAIGFKIQNGSILCVQTSGGHTIHPRWVVDASGAAASVLGRELNLHSTVFGPRKIALWAHFNIPDWAEGTTLYALDSGSQYMDWIWEIPVSDGITSVGYVAPGFSAKQQRASGLTNAELLASQMQKFPRLNAMLQGKPPAHVAATSFLCRTYQTVCGPNWVIMGEAASQSDPITGNGVTAALRHADEGSALILRHQQGGCIPALARFVYNLRVSGLGCYFNSLIEKLYYETAIRSLLGLFVIARLYTVPAWLTNVLYTRRRPRGLAGTLALCGAMLTLRGAAWGLSRLSGLFKRRPDQHAAHSSQHRVIVLDDLDRRTEAAHALHLSR